MISNTMVVTAASCWDDGVIRGHTLTVILGSPTLYFGGTRYATRTVIMHPNWNPTNIDSLRFNVALIPIRHTAYTSIIRSATLPSGSLLNNNFVNSIARASGFGWLRDENNIGAFQFQYHVNLRVIANSDCSRFYTGITDGLLCTSGEGTVGLCRGDTGGPLAISSGGNNVLIGVSSFFSQYGCEAQRPSGFTRVTSVVDWIRTEMNRRHAQ